MDYIYCRSCGGKNPEDATFCNRCGKRLDFSIDVVDLTDTETTESTTTSTVPPPSESTEPDAKWWNNKGNEYYSKDDYESALDCYSKAIQLDPTLWAGWYNSSLTLSKLGRKGEADEAKKKADELKKSQSSTTPKETTERQPNGDKREREWCRNCGAELPYSQRQWPPGHPKLCPKCGIRVQDPVRYGERQGQGRTHSEELKSPGLAALLSIIPGLGQVYNGQVGKGLLLLFGTTLGLILIIPSVILWVYGIYDAYKTAIKMNYGDFPFKKVKISQGVVYSISIILCVLISAAILSSLLTSSGISSNLGETLNTAGTPIPTLTILSTPTSTLTLSPTPPTVMTTSLAIRPTTITTAAQVGSGYLPGQLGNQKIVDITDAGRRKILSVTNEGSQKILAANNDANQKITAVTDEGTHNVTKATNEANQKMVAAINEADQKMVAAINEGTQKILVATNEGSVQKKVDATNEMTKKIVDATNEMTKKIVNASNEMNQRIISTSSAASNEGTQKSADAMTEKTYKVADAASEMVYKITDIASEMTRELATA